MNAIWDRWIYFNLDMLFRHVGTAGLATCATLYVNGHWGWKAFCSGIVAGAVIPTCCRILQRGLPKRDDVPTPDE
jgi:hypothetical protein